MTAVTLKVSGMACAGCASKIKQATEELAGVISTDVILENGDVNIIYTEDEKANPVHFRTIIEDLGFDVEA